MKMKRKWKKKEGNKEIISSNIASEKNFIRCCEDSFLLFIKGKIILRIREEKKKNLYDMLRSTDYAIPIENCHFKFA